MSFEEVILTRVNENFQSLLIRQVLISYRYLFIIEDTLIDKQ